MDSWRDDAECRDTDPEVFFPVGSSGPALMQAERAKAICRRCPVADICLAWALSADQAGFGVWGGTDEAERERLRRRGTRAYAFA